MAGALPFANAIATAASLTLARAPTQGLIVRKSVDLSSYSLKQKSRPFVIEDHVGGGFFERT